MKQTITGPSAPMAGICINKSRLKTYYNNTLPTYYLEKGAEFQVELYNPTSGTILAKIQLNGNQISQGGLVLRPGERVFLERYIDVAKKFLFDTYTVANNAEVKKAIEDNGDFKVEFFRESKPLPTYYGTTTTTYSQYPYTLTIGGGYNSGDNLRNYSSYYNGNINLTGMLSSSGSNSTGTIPIGSTITNTSSATYFNSEVTMDGFLPDEQPVKKLKTLNSLRKKTIETGRVEAGSQSNQKLATVSKSFDYYPFHTVEYKLLPLSQRVNTVDDIQVKRYCTSCGKKSVKSDKFCSQCGNKL